MARGKGLLHETANGVSKILVLGLEQTTTHGGLSRKRARKLAHSIGGERVSEFVSVSLIRDKTSPGASV